MLVQLLERRFINLYFPGSINNLLRSVRVKNSDCISAFLIRDFTSFPKLKNEDEDALMRKTKT